MKISRWQYNTRWRILIFVRYAICKEKEGQMMGRIPRICFALLFPFHALYAKQSECHYDRLTDIYTIRGMKFSGTIFNYFNNECNKGKIVKMVQHDGEVCTIQYLTDKELEQAVHLNNELERVLNEASK